MTTYTVRPGDTYEGISRSQFGSDERAADIIAANPGASEVPTDGVTLIIPGFRPPLPPSEAEAGTLSVTVDGVRFTGWTRVAFTRSMDTFGSFSLLSVWEPDNTELRSVFRPFSYKNISIFEGGDLLFNGTMIDITPAQSSVERSITASGYALPGVVHDCTPPISALPLEGDIQTLQQVATSLLQPFGLPVEFAVDPGPAFQREAIQPTQKVFEYLAELAKQRKFIMTDTPEGACLFQTEIDAGNPVATLVDGQAGVTVITPQFSPQEYYSHISGQGFALFSTPTAVAGGALTVTNSRLQGVLRPFTFSAPDAIGGELQAAVDAKMGRMFANAVTYDVEVPSWRNGEGDRWQPNTTIILSAPGAMIYEPFEFLIRTVRYSRTEKRESAILGLVLPGVFNGIVPEALPWDL